MAGYTSRFLFTLTVPSIFGFLGVLWFLRRKHKNSEKIAWNKGIEVIEVIDNNLDKAQYSTATPMKLKEVGSSADEAIKVSSSDMHLKETSTSVEKQTQLANGTSMHLKETSTSIEKQTQLTNGTSTQSPKGRGKKGRSKVRENSVTCSTTEATTNGCSKDKTVSLLQDPPIDLSNEMDALSLNIKDVHQNGIISQSTDISENIMTETITTEKDRSLYSCHFKTQALPKTTTDSVQNTSSEVTKEDSVSESAAKEQCDSDSSCQSNSDSSQACSSVTDTSQPLTLPIEECPVIVPSSEEMLESPGVKYCDSVGSNDSGKGGSEFQFLLDQNNYCMLYEFEILGDLCGLLIGKKGCHVKLIKEKTNSNILIKTHPYYDELKICSITGSEDEIHAALKLLRHRFPIEKYPSVTLSQINSLPLEFQLPETLKLSLPEGVSFESMLCATVSAGHFFLQQPTHPTFHSLPALTSQMTALYSQLETPLLTHVDKGYVCVAGLTSGWFRAEVDEVLESSDECRLKFLDYGGYSVVPRSSLRQIRYDFMNVPFQATECLLGSVTFLEGETGWSAEATAAFEELAQGQIVQGYIIGYSENRVPYVHLHKITGATTEFINRELVSRGLARWVDGPL